MKIPYSSICLIVGMATGLSVALSQIVQRPSPLPNDAIALVNGHAVQATVYEQALNALDQERRREVTTQDRQDVLNRLIDEQLLIQQALKSGLAYNDRTVKNALVTAMLESQRMQAAAEPISEDDLQAFYQQQPGLFRGETRYRAGLIRVPYEDNKQAALERANTAREALQQGADFQTVADQYHRGGALNLPDVLLPQAKLSDYFGPALAEQISQLQALQATVPKPSRSAWLIAYLYEKQNLAPPAWAQLKTQVEAEVRRRRAEDLLATQLRLWREQAHIVVANDLTGQ